MQPFNPCGIKFYSLQEKLAKKVELTDGFEKLERIAGADLAYSKNTAFCAAVVLDYATMGLLEKNVVKAEVRFPYIPTLLAFREIKPIMKAIKNLEFDILLLDGHGIAHPRSLGIASHLGVLLDIPTIGVAKSILCGKVKTKIKLKEAAPLIYNNIQVGYAIQTKKGTHPIYISPGHKVSLESVLRIVQHCVKLHKLPEPIRLAHELANRTKQEHEHR